MFSNRLKYKEHSTAQGATTPPVRPPIKEVTGLEQPVRSPVHVLQAELRRVERNGVIYDHAGVAKAPGWLKLALPLGTSTVLWAAIIWAWTITA